MKKSLFIMCVAALMVPLAGQAIILFQDTFDRPDTNYRLDASGNPSAALGAPLDALDQTSSGMSGTLLDYGTTSSNTWKEAPGLDGPFVTSSNFSKRTKADYVAALNIDFQDASLATIAGGTYSGKLHLRAQMDVLRVSTTANVGDLWDRYVGFGLGYSQADAITAETNFTSLGGGRGVRPGHVDNLVDPLGPQNQTGLTFSVFVDLLPVIGTTNGAPFPDNLPSNSIPYIGIYTSRFDCVRIPWPGATNGTLTLDCAYDAVAAGSLCRFVVSHDGTALYAGSVIQPNSDNYLAISGRGGDDLSQRGDNLIVSTTTDPLPVPVKLLGLLASPTAIDDDITTNAVTLVYNGFNLVESNSTYAITVTEGAATFPNSDDTGAASNGAHIVAAVVDGTTGAQTVFQIIVTEGAVPVLTNTVTVTHEPRPPALTTVLFGDNFTRTNSILDATTNSMSGTLRDSMYPDYYLETLQWNQVSNGNDTVCIITNNLCSLSRSNATINAVEGGVGINHNFIDAAITTAGNFSMSARITADSPSGTFNRDRHVSLHAGCTLDEINAWTKVDDLADRSVRGSLEGEISLRGLTGKADFSVSMDRGGRLQVITAGYAAWIKADVGSANPTGDLRVDFGVTDFNQGSFVSYIVYWNSVPQTSGFFRWQNASQNWLAFSGRAERSATGARLDTLRIGTLTTYEGPDTGTPPTLVGVAASARPTAAGTTNIVIGGVTNFVVTAIEVAADAGASNVVYAAQYRPSLIYDDWKLVGKNDDYGGELVIGHYISELSPAIAYSRSFNPLESGGATNDVSAFVRLIPINWRADPAP